MKRKGFAINEMLFMIPVIIVLMMMCNKPLRFLTGDLLRDQRDLQANISVGHMLRGLRVEIERAKGLPEQSGGTKAGEKVLLIETVNEVICYEHIGDKVIKRIVGGERDESAGVIDTWKVGHAEINWKALRRDGKDYAVEVVTSINRISGGQLHKKLKNSHVFFVNGPGRLQEEI
jgi:hypothetical protein